MKKQAVFAAAILLLCGLCAAETPDEDLPEEFVFIIGPRIGLGYTFVEPEQFTKKINDAFFTDYDYYPLNSCYGFSMEQRIGLGETNNHFAFQEVISINGLEQALALPVAAVLIGYRDESGFEFGTGPLLSFSGLQIVIAAGWTIKTRGIYIPIDVSYTLPNAKADASIALTSGFNFIIGKRKPRSW